VHYRKRRKTLIQGGTYETVDVRNRLSVRETEISVRKWTLMSVQGPRASLWFCPWSLKLKWQNVQWIVNSVNYFNCSEVGNYSDPFKMRVVTTFFSVPSSCCCDFWAEGLALACILMTLLTSLEMETFSFSERYKTKTKTLSYTQKTFWARNLILCSFPAQNQFAI